LSFLEDRAVGGAWAAASLFGSAMLTLKTMHYLGLPDDSAWIIPIGIFYMLFIVLVIRKVLDWIAWIVTGGGPQ
jgi:hypothetical protein